MCRSWSLTASRLVVAAIYFAASGAMATNLPLSQPNPKLAIAGNVYAVLKQADGGTLIGGEFASVNGLPRHNLARRRPDGQVDPDWQADADGPVYALTGDSSGSIFVGGRFESIQGQPRNALAKLSSNGLVDSLWHPSIDYGNSFGRVNAIAIDTASGSVYLAGQFDNVDGEPRISLAKVSASGSGALDAIWNPSVGNSLDALAVAADGAVYIGGQFDIAGGLERHNIAKLSSTTGAADPSWDADPNGAVLALSVDSAERLYAGGDFDQIGGQARRGVARLLVTGSADPSWDKYLGNPAYVLALDLSDAGELYVGGTFNPLGGLPDVGNVVRFDVAGDLDSSWMPVTNQRVRAIDAADAGSIAIGGDFNTVDESLRLGFAEINGSGALAPAIDAELPGSVFAIAVQPNGGTIVGGNFLKGGGIARANILRIMPGGEVDPVWNPSADGKIWALATDGNDSVYAAGQFSRIGGIQHARMAKIDFNAAGGVNPSWGMPQGGYVYSIAVDESGDVYLGGSFLGFAGVQQHYLAKSSRDGAVDTNWNPPRDRYVTDFADTVDGQVDVLYFSSVFPVNTGEIKRVLKLNGSVTHNWTLDQAAAGITSRNGTLYVHGNFNQVDGVDVPHLARIRPDGLVDPNWHVQFDGSASSMVIGSDNEIYLGGDMFINNIDYKLLKLSADDAQVDAGWNHSVAGFVRCLTVNQQGTLLVGGEFDAVDDARRAGFAALGLGDAIFSNGFEIPPSQP